MKKIAILGLVAIMIMASLMTMMPEDAKANPTPGLLYHTTAGNDVYQVAISGDGSLSAAVSKDGYVYIMNETGLIKKFAITPSGEYPTDLAISRNGEYIVVGDSNGVVWLFNKKGEVLDTWSGIWGIDSLDISENGKWVVVLDNLGQDVNIFNTSANTLALIDTNSTGNYLDVVDISDDGAHVMAFEEYGNVMIFYDLNSEGKISSHWSSIWNPPSNANIEWADMSEDGTNIAVATDNKKLYLFEPGTDAPSEDWSAVFENNVDSVSISGDSDKILCNVGIDMYLFDSSSNRPICVFDGWGGKITYDGRYNVIYDYDSISLQSSENETMWTYPVSNWVSLNQIAISDDGSHAIVADDSYDMYYMDWTPDPTPESHLIAKRTAGDDVYQTSVSGNGSTAAAASADGSIYIFDRSGFKTTFLVSSGKEATSVSVSRDGNYIVGGDSSGYLWLLDSNGNSLDSWNGPSESYVHDTDISKNGNYIIESDDVGISYFDSSSHDLSKRDWYNVNYPYYMVDMSDDGNHILLFNYTYVTVLNGSGTNLWGGNWKPSDNSNIRWADISEDGSKVVVLTDSKSLYLLRASNGIIDWHAALPDYGDTVSISGDGTKIVCSGFISTYLFSSSSNRPLYVWSGWQPVKISYNGEYATSYYPGIRLQSIDNETVWDYPISDYIPWNSWLDASFAYDDMDISDYGAYIIAADANNNIYYLASLPETEQSYDRFWNSGNTLYLSPETKISLNTSYIAPSVTTYWKIDSGSYQTYSSPFNLSPYAQGSHTISYYSVDSYGNTESSVNSFDVCLDRTFPTMSLDFPSDNSIVNTSNVIVRWHGGDVESAISYYEVSTDGGPWTDVGITSTYTFLQLAEGSHTVRIRGYDHVGNTAETSVNFTVDATPPNITATFPSDGSMLNTSSLTVSWTGSDATSGISHYEVRIDGGNWKDVGTNTSYDFTGLSDGSHTADVEAVDNASNEESDSVTFTVDTTNPVVSITSPSEGEVSNASSVTVTWTGSDNTSEIGHYEIRIDGASWISVGTNTSYEIKRLTNGSHKIDVKAVDSAGNEQVQSVHMTTSVGTPPGGGSGSGTNEAGPSSFPWWIFIVIILFLFILLIAMKKRRKRDEEDETEDETEEEPDAEDSDEVEEATEEI